MVQRIAEFAMTVRYLQNNSACFTSVFRKPRLHDTTCCQLVVKPLTTGCTVNTAGCQTGFTTRIDTWLKEQWLFVRPIVQPGLTTA